MLGPFYQTARLKAGQGVKSFDVFCPTIACAFLGLDSSLNRSGHEGRARCGCAAHSGKLEEIVKHTYKNGYSLDA